MTSDLDAAASDASGLADALRDHLNRTFHIAVRVREVVPGGFRIDQVRSPKNRHLVDLRQTVELPEHDVVQGVAVATPTELVAMKVLSLTARRGREKGVSDRLDLHRLLNAVPELRAEHGVVSERLLARGADDAEMATWREIVHEDIVADDEDGW